MFFVYDFSCQNPNANIHTNCRFCSQPHIKGDNYFRCQRFSAVFRFAPLENDGQRKRWQMPVSIADVRADAHI